MPSRARRTTALWATALLTAAGCSADRATGPTARGATAAAPRATHPGGPRYDFNVGYPTGPVSIALDGGTAVIDPGASTLTWNGTTVLLAPDALDYYLSAWQALQQTDLIATTITSVTAQRRAAHPSPSQPPCDGSYFNGRCVPNSGPQRAPSVPVRPLGGLPGAPEAGTTSTTTTDLYGLPFDAINTGPGWSCRDISLALRDEMVGYNQARSQYLVALALLTPAAIAVGGPINPDPPVGTPMLPPAVTLAQIFARYSLTVTAFNYELAWANWQAARARVGYIGTQFALNDCINQDWDPPPAQSPAPAGGGGANGGAASVNTCYYERSYVDGYLVSWRLLYCTPQ